MPENILKEDVVYYVGLPYIWRFLKNRRQIGSANAAEVCLWNRWASENPPTRLIQRIVGEDDCAHSCRTVPPREV